VRTIIGFDLSLTCTGWATWTEGALNTGRIIPKKLTGKERRRWIAEHVAGLTDAAYLDGGDPLLIIEGVPTHGAYNIVTLAELHGVVRDHLDGYRPAYMDPSKLKKWATGNGNCKKAAMLPAAQTELGYAGKSEDEADAAWLAMVGRQLLGDTGPLFTAQRAALLAGVSWPEGMDVALGGAA
jgi:hypothetical protein